MATKRTSRQRDRKRQRGAALVEGALVLLPFMTLILGIVSLGLNFFLVDALQDRAAMAARYAALNPSDSAGTKNMMLYGVPELGDEQISTPPPSYLNMTEGNVSVTRYDVGLPSDRMVVTIQGYRLPLFIPGQVPSLVGAPISATIPVETVVD